MAGAAGGIYLTMPVLRWHRENAESAHAVRRRALRIPLYHAILHLALWTIGVALITLISVTTLGDGAATIAVAGAATIAVAGALGAITTSALGYLAAERILRPVAAEALKYGVMEQTAVPGVSRRILITWATSTGIPVLGSLLMVIGLKTGYLPSDSDRVLDVVLAVCVITLVVGGIAFALIGGAIGDPIRQLSEAQRKVQSGDLHAQVAIYDGSEIGLLQAGFNALISGLEERQRLRDLIGRYVGEDVARRARSMRSAPLQRARADKPGVRSRSRVQAG